jgi:hypothetical protein
MAWVEVILWGPSMTIFPPLYRSTLYSHASHKHPAPHSFSSQVLATNIRNIISTTRTKGRRVNVNDGFVPSTRKIINRYLDGKNQRLYPEPKDVFPCDILQSSGGASTCPT